VRVEKGNGTRPWVVGQILPLGALVGGELVGEETKGREARNSVVRFKKKKGKSAGAETPRFRESGGRCMSVWYDSVQCSLQSQPRLTRTCRIGLPNLGAMQRLLKGKEQVRRGV
jgi:hypothetical protein